MPLEFGHETLAETHHLCIGLASRAEIGAALSTSHRKGGETVLECLFEGEELEDAEIDAGVEADTSLVRSDGTVHLDSVASVDLDSATVIHPRDAEHDDSFRLCHPLHDLEIHQMRILDNVRGHTGDDLAYSLVEFTLSRVLRDER